MNGGTLANYLPGCYANLRPEGDESLPGFLLRLAERNRYAGISDFLSSVLSGLNSQSLRPQLMEIRKSPALLTRLGRVACGDDNGPAGFPSASAWVSDAVMMHGCRVPTYGLPLCKQSVCPHCLDEQAIAARNGSFRRSLSAPVTNASAHQQLRAMRPFVGLESRQRYPLRPVQRLARGRDPATTGGDRAGECRTAEDFSALADFRVELNEGERPPCHGSQPSTSRGHCRSRPRHG